MRNFGLPWPKENAPDDDTPYFVKEEQNHQLKHLLKVFQQAENNLNAEQPDVY